MHLQPERIGKGMRRGRGTPQIRAYDQPVRNIRATVNIQFTQCDRCLANLPLADFVEGNVDLALQTMLRIVGSAPVTYQCDGVHMFRYCAVMLKFDVSRHAAVLRCFLDYGIGEYHFA